jgi:hypothetical protein
MTTGSWTIGNPLYQTSNLYARKSWSGGNGKTETWQGGTRVKWNDYAMFHHRFFTSKDVNSPIFSNGYGALTNQDEVSLKAKCGWTANDDLRLLDKLAQTIRGHSFDLGINIAEASKTYASILGNLRSLGTALVDLKHGNIAGAFRALGVPSKRRRRLRAKDVSGRWLEMQYGWLPLASQSFEASKALAAVTGPRVLRFSASVATKHGSYDGSAGPTHYKYPVNVSFSSRILAELYEDISLQRSLGLVDPLSIAWEVVPYSFVVDWFLPVGTYLSALSIIPRLKGRFLTTTRLAQKAGQFIPLGGGLEKDCGKVERWFVTRRTVSNSLSVPMPTFKSLPQALSPRHIFNGVALIHQLLK